MTTKNLVVLAVAAVALGTAAYLTRSGKTQAPSLSGKKVMPAFDVEKVAAITVGDKVTLKAGEKGWIIASMQDYPADRGKISENLMKLQELKVGQVARGRQLGTKTVVTVKDVAGQELASVTLGDRHEKWGHGRYVDFGGTTVLVSETLDAFGDDSKNWCDTKIVDTPYVNFKELAAPTLTEAELGFATGVTAKVTIAGNTNRVATVGNVVKGGSDRYLKLDGEKWIFVVPSYSVDSLLPKPPPKPEPKAETKPATPKADANPAAKPAVKPAAKPAKKPAAKPEKK